MHREISIYLDKAERAADIDFNKVNKVSYTYSSGAIEMKSLLETFP